MNLSLKQVQKMPAKMGGLNSLFYERRLKAFVLFSLVKLK